MSPFVAPSRRAPAILAVLAVLPLIFAGSCGKKGDPMPPILQVPAAAKQLSVVQRGDRLLVDLEYPRTTVAGTPLGELTGLTVSGLVVPMPPTVPGEPPVPPEIDDQQFQAGATPLAELDAEEVGDAVRGGRLVFEAPVPEPTAETTSEAGSALSLVVATQGPDGQASPPSNRLTYRMVAPPEPPTAIEANPQAGGVRVRWSHPLIEAYQEQARARREAAEEGAEAEEGEEADGAEAMEDEDEEEAAEDEEVAAADDDLPPLAGFNIYRRLATERVYGPPVRSIGPRADTLLDEGALFGQRYIYAVTAVSARRPVLVESDFVEEVEVDYRDRFAPPRPQGLVALTEGRQVRLVWEESEAPDLAGYRLYRRSPATQEFGPVTDELIEGTSHSDRDLAAGATYTYRVTAVDELGNESDPSAPVTAAIR